MTQVIEPKTPTRTRSKEPTEEGLTKEIYAELKKHRFDPHRPHHKVGIKTQTLANVRSLNKYYRTQKNWWVSPAGKIMHLSEAHCLIPLETHCLIES